MNITPEQAVQLAKALDGALGNNDSTFMWDNHQFDVRYAHYLLEYLQDQWGPAQVKELSTLHKLKIRRMEMMGK